MNPETSHPNSIPNLVRELRDETTPLLRQEVALAKSEMKENVSRMGGHAAQIAIGGFVAYAGIIVLLIATITLSLFLRQPPQSGERLSMKETPGLLGSDAWAPPS